MSKENENYKITKTLTETRLKEICTFFKSKNLQEFELIEGDQKIILKASPENQPMVMVNSHQLGMNQISTSQSLNETATSEVTTTREEKLDGNPVSAPISGTFYASPSPDAPPYIQVGDSVKKGDKLCIIEAMKVMNEIDSPFTGKVVAIKAINGKSVKQGEVMVVIK